MFVCKCKTYKYNKEVIKRTFGNYLFDYCGMELFCIK